jgi:hypothetical protein
MSKSAFPIRFLGVVGVVSLLAFVLAVPTGALAPHLQTQPEPFPRPSPIDVPFIELNPTQGVAGNATQVVVTGHLWTVNTTVILYWDDESLPVANGPADGDGNFEIGFLTPTDAAHATVGAHPVIAKQGAFRAEASFVLIAPSPTPTFTPLPPPGLALNPAQGTAGDKTKVTATGSQWVAGQVVTLYWDGLGGQQLGQTTVRTDGTIEFKFETPHKGSAAAVGNHTVLAVSPNGQQAQAIFTLIQATATATASPTLTASPSPTLMPITPMMTITPIPPTSKPPSVATSTPVHTRTSTPIPGTATSTPTPSNTPTPSITPTITNTPGPGTPSVTPQPTSAPTLTPTPEQEISETGAGWGPIFLWGAVLGGLVVVFRLLRVRNLHEPH